MVWRGVGQAVPEAFPRDPGLVLVVQEPKQTMAIAQVFKLLEL